MRFRHLTSAVAQILLNASGGAILQRGGNLLVSGYRDGANESGAVYLYNSALELQTTILPPENKPNYNFGAKIALGDNKIAVGNADRYNTGGGVVHIYDLDGSNRIDLQASDGVSNNYYGWWLDISGDTLVVGAGESKKVYIYDLSASDIASTEVMIHKPNVVGFGHTVTVGHGKVVVGAWEHVTPYGSGELKGAAYIYDIDGTNEIELIPAQNGHTLGYSTVNYGNGPQAVDEFGKQVGISADKIFVSSRLSGNNNNGAVYTYNHDGSGESMIFAPTIQPGQETYFGMDFAVTDSKLVVGAPDLGGAGGPGSVWVMDHDGSNYVQITSSHTTQFMGRAVAVVADKVVASYENGDTAGNNRGQIHVFDMDGSNEVVITSSGDNEDNDLWGNPVDGTSGSYPMKMFVAEGFKTYANDQKIYVMDIDGENLIELSAPEGLSQPSNSRYADNIEVSGTNLVAIDPHGNTAYVYDLTSTGEPTSFSLDSTISGSATDNFVLEGNRLIVNRNPYGSPGRILVYNITNGNLDASFTNSDSAGFMRMDVGNDKIVATSGYGDTRKIYVYDIDDTTGSSEIIITPPAPSNLSSNCNVAVGNGKIAYADYDADNTFYIYNLDGSNEVVVDVSSATLAGYSNFGQSGQWRVGDWTMAIGNERIVLGTNFTGVFIISDLDGSNITAINMSSLGYFGDATAGFASNNDGQIYVVNSKIMIAATNGRTSGNESDGIVYTFDLDGSNPKQILSPRGTGSGYHFGKDIAANDPTGLAKFANLPAVISNISSVYTLTEGQDTVITGTAVDPEGDAVTWSFEEVATGNSYVIATAFNDDDNGSNSGSLYVYDATDMSAQPTKISGPNANAKFGGSVAQYANKLYVGSWTATNANKVYQYDLTNLSAAPVEILPPTSYTDGSFGKHVNIVDDKLAVSTSSGPYKVFLYDTNDLSAEPEVISNPSTDTGNYFGSVVTSNSTHIFIAARADNGGGGYHGAVFAYDKNNLSAAPVELREIGRYGNSEEFGRTIAADDSHVLISRYGAAGTGGVYRYDANDLSASPTIIGHWDDPNAVGISLGSSTILITEDKVIVGASYAGAPLNDPYNSDATGRVYVFDKTEFMTASSLPTPVATLSGGPNANQWDEFGSNFSIVGSTLIVSNASDDDAASNAGSFFTFDLNDLSAAGTEIYAYDAAATDSFGWRVLGVPPTSSLNDVTVSQSDNVFTVTPGTTDSNFTLRFKVTDAAGNVTTKTSTFTYDYVNKAPTVSGIVSQYNLTQGQDTVITASATDPEGDAITWSFEEVLGSGIFVRDSNDTYAYNPATMQLTDTIQDPLTLMTVGGGKLAGKHGNSIKVYDLNDLSATPFEMQYQATAESIALSSNYLIVGHTSLQNNRGQIHVHDLNNLDPYGDNKTVLLSPSNFINRQFGDNVVVSGNKLICTQQTAPNESYGIVIIYDLTDLSAAPTTLIAPQNTTLLDCSLGATETHFVLGSSYEYNGTQANAGAVYVYDTNDLSAEPTKLNATMSQSARFGSKIAVSDDYILVKRENNDSVYVFDMNNLSAPELKIIGKPSYDANSFGDDLAIAGDKLFIGDKTLNTSRGTLFVYDATDLDAAPQEISGSNTYVAFSDNMVGYTSSSALNGVTITQSDNVFTITPGTADASFTLRITATDSNGNATSVTPTFGLNYVNQAPVISGVNTAYTLTQGQDTVITASATDPEGDAITWSFEEIRSGSRYIAVTASTDDDGADASGSVYVYDSGDLSAQPIKLSNPEPGAHDRFGYSVSMTADKLVVGAAHDASPEAYSGSVYVYNLTDLSAAPTKLEAGGANDRFGNSVATNSNYIFVTSPNDDDAADNAGAVYVYDINDLSAQPTKLTPDNSVYGGVGVDGFMASIDADDNYMVVGAYDDNSFEGAAYVYDVSNLSATPTKLTQSGSRFMGSTVRVFDDVIIVGSPSANSNVGEVYVYDANNLGAAPTVLEANDGISGMRRFGSAIEVNSDYIFVGANAGPWEAFYRFDRSDLSAAPVKVNKEIGDINDGPQRSLGSSMRLIDNSLFVGANQGDHGFAHGGSLYVYDITDLSAAPTLIIPNDLATGDNFGAQIAISSLPSALNGVTVTQSDNVFTVTPGTADASFQLRITATDSAGNATSVTPTFGLNYVNQAPAVSGIESAYTLTQGQDTVIAAAATDPEGDAITWSFEEVKSGSSYIAVGAPLDDVHGTNTGTVYVYDASNLNAQPVTLSPVSGNFGSSMFMTSTKLYVGAYGDDNGANNSGGAYVYDLTDLSAAPTILSPSSTANDSVGWSVSATETHVVVSAHNDDTRTNNAGAVYVYEVSNLAGTPTKLVTPDGGNSDQFGRAVHIDSNNVYVGCRQHGTYTHGAVYVYSLSDLSAAPTKLEDGTYYLQLGCDLASDDTNLYVGAMGYNDRRGAVFAYTLSDLSAAPTIITESELASNSYFGERVDARHGSLAIGAERKTENGTAYQGAVYVYDASDLSAAPTKLTAPDDGDTEFEYFGQDVSINEDNIVIGANMDDGRNGSAWVYDRNDLSAAPTKLGGNIGLAYDDRFGWAVASVSAQSALNGVTVTQSDNVFTVTPGQQDATFTLLFKATDSEGNVTSTTSDFTLDYVNQAPSVTGIDAAYTLTQGQDTVITASATDPEGDAITWSYEAVATGTSYVVISADGNRSDLGRSESVYVYDSTDLTQPAYTLENPNGVGVDDYFGKSIATTGDKIIVSAHEADDVASNAGAVYVYDANDLNAAPTKLTAFDYAVNDRFGTAVAATANKIVVGAPYDDDNGNNSGSIYVFDANDLSAQPTKLTAFDGAENDTFGSVIAATEDKIFVSATNDDDNGADSGSIYVFDTNDLSAQPTKLTPFDGAASNYLGVELSTGNGKIVITTYSGYTGPAGNNSAKAYVYNEEDLSYVGTITPPDLVFDGMASYQSFSINSVTTTENHILIGSQGYDSGRGIVLVYDINTLNYVQSITRNSSNAYWASSMHVFDGKLYTGAYDQDVNDNGFHDKAGSVFVYDASDFSFIEQITEAQPEVDRFFGRSIVSYSPSPALNGVTVTQSDNVFTVTPGQQDATFTLAFKATDSEGNVTSVSSDFTLDYVNQAPSVTGIDAAYTLTQGQDTVITAAATDAEGDAITWSFEEVQSDINSYVFSDRATAIDFALPSSLGDTWTIETWVKYGSGNGEHDGFFTTATVVPNSDPSNNGIATASYGWTPIPGDGSSPAGDDIEQWVTAGDYSGLPRDTWVHVAISSDGTTARTFVDGILITSTPTVNIGSDTISLGRRWTDIDGSYLFMGSLADFRVVKDTAIYTSNFSVPTEPLTEVPGTVLFTARASTITDSSSNSVSHTLLGSGVSASSDSPYPSSGDTGLLDTTVTQSDNVFTVTPGQQDATFTLAFKATDTAGNVTSVSSDFTLDYVNQAPAVSGIESSYLLSAGGSAEVITAAATDPEGDAITWSFVETGGSGGFDATSVSPIVHHTSAEMKAQFGDFVNMYFATFGDNGNKFYTVFVAGTGFPAGMQGTLRQFTLTTPYDITTATSEVTYDANSLSTIVGIDWSPDGTKAMVSFASTGTDSTKKQVAVLTVSTPWDISSVTSNVSNHDFLSSANISGTTLKNTSNVIWGAKWADNGTKVLTTFRGVGVGLFGMNSEQPYQGTYPTSLQSEWLTTDSVISAEINESGTVLTYNIQGGTDEVLYRELSTPWDLSTVGAEQVLIPSSELTGATRSAINYDENFEYLIVSDSDGDQYVFRADAASSLNGTTVTQSDNVFTVTPGSEATSFSIIFTATDVNGNATSTTSLFTVQESVMPSHPLLTGRKIIVGAAYDSEAGSNAGAAYVYQNNSFRKIVPPSSASNQYLTGQNQTMAFAVGLNRFVLATKDTSFNATAYVHNAFNDAIYHTYERSDFNADFTQSIAMSPEQSNPYIAFRLSGTDGNNARVSVVYSGSEQWYKVGPQNDNMFGDSMAMSNSHLFVGHRTRDVGGSNTGQITKYQLSNGSQKAQINGPSSNQQIGANLAVSTDRVVDGNLYDNSGANSNYKGSVSIYDHNLNLITKIDSPSGNYSKFGSAIDVSGNRIVVGAEESPNVYVYDKNGNSVGTITGQSSHFGQYKGSIAVYGTDGNELIAIGEWLGDAEGSNYGDVYLYDGNLNLIGRLSGHDGGYFGSKVGIM